MLKRIFAFLEKNPDTKAKTIAAELSLDRALVNKLLHEHDDMFEQDSAFQWAVVRDVCRIEFGGDEWLTVRHFEKALCSVSPLESLHSAVVLVLKGDCKPLLEFLALLLALCNQLVEAGKAVTLDLEGSRKTRTYLDRVGFFDLLAAGISVLPQRPEGELGKTYRGNNHGVIEFRLIDPAVRDDDIPRLLRNSFVACAGDDSYSVAALTLLGELFGNVHEHSGTKSPGFICLQHYPRANKIQAVISDNGRGIVGTLLPVVPRLYPVVSRRISAAPHAGVALLTEVFSNGQLSQFDELGRGTGLKSSSDRAGKFRAKISVRQSDFEFCIQHGHDRPRYTHRLNLARLEGTHICFEFRLDAGREAA